MIETSPIAIQNGVAEHATLRHVRFTAQGEPFMQFADPEVCKAVMSFSRVVGTLPEPTPGSDAIDIITVPVSPTDQPSLRDELNQWVGKSPVDGTAPIGTIIHGVQVFWCPGRAALLAAPERLDAVLKALVEFCYFEAELRKLEREIADAWPQLQADSSMSHEVTPLDLERSDEVARRVAQTMQRRMRHARLQPHLLRASAQLSLQAQELGQRLREKSRLEDRHETLDRQLATFEHVYEMASQRLSDYRASKAELKLEWIIIVLLAAEVVLLLAELVLRVER